MAVLCCKETILVRLVNRQIITKIFRGGKGIWLTRKKGRSIMNLLEYVKAKVCGGDSLLKDGGVSYDGS